MRAPDENRRNSSESRLPPGVTLPKDPPSEETLRRLAFQRRFGVLHPKAKIQGTVVEDGDYGLTV